MRKYMTAVVALLLASGPATAAPRAYLDHLYFILQGDVEESVPGAGTGLDSGTGVGIKGMVPAMENLIFTGEGQAVEYDNGGSLVQVRLGAGLVARRGGVLVEYINTNDALETKGYGVHFRVGGRDIYAQVGYLSLTDSFEENTGFEIAGGFSKMFDQHLGMFVDVRQTDLEGGVSGVKIQLTDFRVGLRFMFPRAAGL